MLKTPSVLLGLIVALCLLTPSSARASLNDCSDVYVGAIWIEQGSGLFAVVFLLNEGDASGSYWQMFSQFSADERKSALAMLTAAKLSSHRVHVKTHASDGCSIMVTSQNVRAVYMAHRP